MSVRTIGLDETSYAYLLQVGVREPDILKQLREETARLDAGSMQISPEQGQFMRFLVEMTGARKAVELGTFTGYSALSIVLAMPPDGQLIACDKNAEWTQIARRYWAAAGVADRIQLRIGKAAATLDSLITEGNAGTFDFAFIDADKKNYPIYYEQCLSLLRPGGVIAIDNTLWGGRAASQAQHDPATTAIRALNAAIRNDRRVSMALVPIGDGLMLVRKQ